ncbi:MAG: DUF3566 domain-containing protein [Acidimicrobiales bacterium]|nr:DUF3566 domain-containing protein [Acidimicrobiales bacterium]
MADQTRVGARERRGTGSTGGARSGAGDEPEVDLDATSSGGATSTSTAPGDASPSGRGSATVPAVAPDDAEWSTPTDADAASSQGDQPQVTPADHDGAGTGSSTLTPLQRLVRPRGQVRARKVHRIVRRIDPWSVLKVSLLFYLCVWVMAMVAVVLLWGVAVGSGTVASLESFIAEFLAFEEFRFNGDQLFQIFALGGLIGAFVTTAVTAILAVVFNLIADLTGGIRFTVVEEESARRVLPRHEQPSATHR